MNSQRLLKWFWEIDNWRRTRGERQSVVFVVWWYQSCVKLYSFWGHWVQNSYYESCSWAHKHRYMILLEAWVQRVYSRQPFGDTEWRRRMQEFQSLIWYGICTGIQHYLLTMPHEMLTHVWQSQDTQIPLHKSTSTEHWIKSYWSIWHLTMHFEISHTQANVFKTGRWL